MSAQLTAAMFLAATLVGASASAVESASDDAICVRATIELADGSRLIGTPADEPLSLTLDFAQLSIPLAKISQWDAVASADGPARGSADAASANKVTVQFANGDRLTGTLNQSNLQLETILGSLSPKLKDIRSVSYAAWRQGNTPALQPHEMFQL